MNSELPDPVTPPEGLPATETPAIAEPALEAAPADAAPEPDATEAVAQDAVTEPAAPAVDVAAELKARFPALFAGRPKPVKLRIQADIQERAPGLFSKTQLSTFLRRHTGSTSYLTVLTQAKTRFDLDGQPAGELSEEHLTVAREELARRRGLQQDRQAAEQQQAHLEAQQRRNRAQLLWDFERTTLTEGNFCVLKGTTAEALPGLLELARQERAEAPPAPAREDRRPARRDDRPQGGRPPRRDQARR